jgi:DNA-binding NtrC family response regulator
MTVAANTLLVEDDALVRFALAAALAEVGIIAIEAGNSLEALNALSATDDIQVGVTDIDMPGSVNGLGLVRWLREGRPYIRIVIISGQPLPKDIRIPDDIAFMLKTFSFERLADVVRELLSD